MKVKFEFPTMKDTHRGDLIWNEESPRIVYRGIEYGPLEIETIFVDEYASDEEQLLEAAHREGFDLRGCWPPLETAMSQ